MRMEGEAVWTEGKDVETECGAFVGVSVAFQPQWETLLPPLL